jgi:hydrogenase expression/formation protein HypE
VVADGIELSADRARPGDIVLLSGPIGEHGIAILAQREGLEFESTIASDSAALHTLTAAMLKESSEIRCMRDPTRGGLSSALNEIAAQSHIGIELEESAIQVREEVKGACEMLGLDPLYVANEGKVIAIVDSGVADNILTVMRNHPLGRQSQVIGKATGKNAGLVTMKTPLGTTRIVDMLAGDQLPRIC